MSKKRGAKRILAEMLERERGFTSAFLTELFALKKKLYEPFTRDEQLRELSAEFGEFLITMRVSQCGVNDRGDKLYKTNTGMAPDMLQETLGKMFDRFIKSKT